MQPDLEVVQIGQGQSFKAWEHGLPFHTVRWHFHPELEVHHVVATSGRCYIGDHIGEFGPGQLVLTGPNLPHNWISDVPEGTVIPLRNRIVQFPETLLHQIAELFPETGGFRQLDDLPEPAKIQLSNAVRRWSSGARTLCFASRLTGERSFSTTSN